MSNFVTKNNYNFFEVLSAFQKSIRRGEEEQAMFWAIELYESGPASITTAWNRMIIMASEDVGLGEPYTITAIMGCKQAYDHLKSTNNRHKPEKLPFTQAVLHLVRAKKSRYVDLAISVYWHKHDKEPLAIPDYVYDMHTTRGKAMGRGLEHFYAEAAKINNPNKLPNEERMEQLAKYADMKVDYPAEGGSVPPPGKEPGLFND